MVCGGGTHTATHAKTSNATQEIEDINFHSQLCQLGETTQEALEAHGFGAQALSSNCLQTCVVGTECTTVYGSGTCEKPHSKELSIGKAVS